MGMSCELGIDEDFNPRKMNREMPKTRDNKTEIKNLLERI
jgi:hypothetical protein